MKEKVYCPKCDSDNVQTREGRAGGNKDAAAAAIDGLTGLLFGMIILSAKEKQDQKYIPVHHYCKDCGYEFLSVNTYWEELDRARKQRRKALILSAFFLLIGGVLSTYCCVLFELTALIFGLICLSVAVFFIVNVVKMSKYIPVLEKELHQMEQTQHKHRNMYY